MTLREYLKKFNLSENDTVSIDVGYTEIEDIKGTEVLETFKEYLDYDVNSVYVYTCADSIDIVFAICAQYKDREMIINLTPHDITITNGTSTVTVKPSGLARCEETSEEIKVVEDWIPVLRTTYGKISGLPEPEENTIYVVSARVAQALKETNPGRTDVMIPAKTLRDSEGNIIGCSGLSIVQL